mgnify:FL=1
MKQSYDVSKKCLVVGHLTNTPTVLATAFDIHWDIAHWDSKCIDSPLYISPLHELST